MTSEVFIWILLVSGALIGSARAEYWRGRALAGESEAKRAAAWERTMCDLGVHLAERHLDELLWSLRGCSCQCPEAP